MSAPQTLDLIDEDLGALEAILTELGGDITEEEAEAAVDAWFEELGAARDAKLNGYARRIQVLEGNAAAKKAEEQRLAQQRKRDEESAGWLKRRLLGFVQRRGVPIKGKDTRQIVTPLYTFTETKNGGKQAITYLVAPKDLPEALREDVVTITVRSGQAAFYEALNAMLMNLADVELEVQEGAKPVEEEVRAALERGAAAFAKRDEEEKRTGEMFPEYPDEQILRFARLEPRGVRLAIR